ncbi:MAG: hypothetical protein AAF363_08440 [Bacteroidota bacterium]
MTLNFISRIFRKRRCAYGQANYEDLSTSELVKLKSITKINLGVLYGTNIILLIVVSITAYNEPAMISLLGASAANVAILDQEHKKLKKINKELRRRTD